MPILEQSAANTVRKLGAGDTGSVYLTTTFGDPTVKGRLVIAVAFATGGLATGFYMRDSRFSPLLAPTFLRDTSLAAWYIQNAPSITNVSISMDSYRGVDLRLFEVSGVAQAASLDKFVWGSGENDSPYSGQTGTLAQSGEYVFACIGSQYASTSQSGFAGGLTRLYEDTVPDSRNEDWERGRVTFHQGIATSTSAQRLTAKLSSTRRWIGFLATFKSGISGPVKLTSTNQNAITAGGHASLTVFGRLKLTDPANQNAFAGVDTTRARIGPFNYQYRLNGWGGTLIGASTSYPVESVDGLEGMTVRHTDVDQPREAGSIRGIDFQNSREVVFKLRASAESDRTAVEALLNTLYTSLTPQQFDDSELVFRHPGRPLRSLYCRPLEVNRHMDLIQALAGEQAFTLRAADPRLYSAVIRTITVPVSPDDSEVVNIVGANNDGNARSYPTIRITGPSSGADVTRVTLFNATSDVAFDVATTLQKGSELIGDMRSRVVGSRNAVVTLNGTSKYAAWQAPREPFYVAPDPEAGGGINLLYLRTVPTGAPVTCTIQYRDCWSG